MTWKKNDGFSTVINSIMKKTYVLLHILFTIALSCTHFHDNHLYITAAPNEVVDIPLEKIFKT